MIALDLFGPCSLSPAQFSNLSPADQTLCVRLMFEKMSSMAGATGLNGAEMRAIGAARHAVVLPDQKERKSMRNADDDGFSLAARKLLALICAADGPVTMTQAEMEGRADIAKGSSRWLLETLKERQLVRCVRTGKGPRQSTWVATEAGRAVMAALMPEVADA